MLFADPKILSGLYICVKFIWRIKTFYIQYTHKIRNAIILLHNVIYNNVIPNIEYIVSIIISELAIIVTVVQ
jgi:hypothetical protein